MLLTSLKHKKTDTPVEDMHLQVSDRLPQLIRLGLRPTHPVGHTRRKGHPEVVFHVTLLGKNVFLG